jgi:hypothetical protein
MDARSYGSTAGPDLHNIDLARCVQGGGYADAKATRVSEADFVKDPRRKL